MNIDSLISSIKEKSKDTRTVTTKRSPNDPQYIQTFLRSSKVYVPFTYNEQSVYWELLEEIKTVLHEKFGIHAKNDIKVGSIQLQWKRLPAQSNVWMYFIVKVTYAHTLSTKNAEIFLKTKDFTPSLRKKITKIMPRFCQAFLKSIQQKEHDVR